MSAHRSSPTVLLSIGLLISGAMVCSSALATEVCVDSAAALHSTLSQAESGGQPVTIKIVQGTYAMTSDLVYSFADPITVEGGYTLNCMSRVIDPANTVISIGAGHAFAWNEFSGASNAEINVEGITFSDATNGLAFHSGAVQSPSHRNGSVTHKQVRFTGISTQDNSTDPIEISAVASPITLENVVVDHVRSDGSCALSLRSVGGASVRINHLTADLSDANDVCMMDGDSPSQVTVYNSILWSSSGGHTIFRGTGSHGGSTQSFVNDEFMGEEFHNPSSIQNAIDTDPQWVNPSAGDYRLQNTSPAINSGTLFVSSGEPATGIDAHARVVGSSPDRGAYESPLSNLSTIKVTNGNDSGAGSLRDAISIANGSGGANLITFDIRNAANVAYCPAIIALTSALPSISGNMKIDGYTQPTAKPNTAEKAFNANLCIIVKPASGTLPTGFTVPVGSSGSLTLRGLAIGGFIQPVRILGGSNSQIVGSQFGGTSHDVELPGAGLNAIVLGTATTGDILVGGVALGDRNVVGGAGSSGIYTNPDAVMGVTSCQIVNNLVGLAPDGLAALANNIGIDSFGVGCQIIGNRVAGNISSNLRIQGDHNFVQQNVVGLNIESAGFANLASGILVTGSNNTIGGYNGADNLVSANFSGGVVVSGNSSVGNAINVNRIFGNGETFNRMDIDLLPTNGIAGPTPNDAGDSDSGTNDLQNFPVPKGLIISGNSATHIAVTLISVLNTLPGEYMIDIYASSTRNENNKRGHAEYIVTSVPVQVPASGTLRFSESIDIPILGSGGMVSMTATNSAGSTSEISTALSTDAIFIDGLD